MSSSPSSFPSFPNEDRASYGPDNRTVSEILVGVGEGCDQKNKMAPDDYPKTLDPNDLTPGGGGVQQPQSTSSTGTAASSSSSSSADNNCDDGNGGDNGDYGAAQEVDMTVLARSLSDTCDSRSETLIGEECRETVPGEPWVDTSETQASSIQTYHDNISSQ